MVIFTLEVLDSPTALAFFSLRTIIFAIACLFLAALLAFVVLSLCARIFAKDVPKGPKALTSSELHEPPRRTILVSLIDRWITVLRHYWGRSRVEIGRAVQQECRDRSRMPSSA
eukprot:TRINITY_DN3640_c0_g1_i22.p1 TRINITY_DN3640_c0_g1~~TRINITY_DN3640_c0_g1_i22.p1  ORF type:complete len:114 (-),score=7.49 TRINITY_DN3640_c0_g1_i22:23-364(-)